MMLTMQVGYTPRGQVFSLDTADSFFMVMTLMVLGDCTSKQPVFSLDTADSVSMVMFRTVPQLTSVSMVMM